MTAFFAAIGTVIGVTTVFLLAVAGVGVLTGVLHVTFTVEKGE